MPRLVATVTARVRSSALGFDSMLRRWVLNIGRYISSSEGPFETLERGKPFSLKRGMTAASSGT